ncbi:MAG: hypothetical protein KTR14_09460 [Vampirovibrio sp.]|nr:hypothetical protein [Vampirovibrio sp.]
MNSVSFPLSTGITGQLLPTQVRQHQILLPPLFGQDKGNEDAIELSFETDSPETPHSESEKAQPFPKIESASDFIKSLAISGLGGLLIFLTTALAVGRPIAGLVLATPFLLAKNFLDDYAEQRRILNWSDIGLLRAKFAKPIGERLQKVIIPLIPNLGFSIFTEDAKAALSKGIHRYVDKAFDLVEDIFENKALKGMSQRLRVEKSITGKVGIIWQGVKENFHDSFQLTVSQLMFKALAFARRKPLIGWPILAVLFLIAYSQGKTLNQFAQDLTKPSARNEPQGAPNNSAPKTDP